MRRDIAGTNITKGCVCALGEGGSGTGGTTIKGCLVSRLLEQLSRTGRWEIGGRESYHHGVCASDGNAC